MKPIPIKQSGPILPQPQALATTGLLSIDMHNSVYFTQMNSCNMWPFLSDFFQLVKCFQDLFILQHVSVIHSLLWLNNISLYGYMIFCLSMHQLIDIELFPPKCQLCLQNIDSSGTTEQADCILAIAIFHPFAFNLLVSLDLM